MIRAVPNDNITLPKGYESSAMRPVRDADSPQRVWQRNNRSHTQGTASNQAIDQLTRQLEKVRRRILANVNTGGGWDWMYPTHKELDTTLSYSVGRFVYISAKNTLVTAGMTDIITNATVVSCEGIWQCVRAVPAASGGKFNVPVFPYPSGLGTSVPSGTPLKGDLDALDGSGNPAIYWIYFGQVAC